MKRNDTDIGRRGSDEDTERYDRRSFMAITGVAGGLGAFASGGGAGVSDREERFRKNETEDGSEGDNGEDGDDADLPTGTEALVGYIEANYGDRLSEGDLASIEADVAADLGAAAAVSEVPLENGDAPAFDFEVYRGRE